VFVASDGKLIYKRKRRLYVGKLILQKEARLYVVKLILEKEAHKLILQKEAQDLNAIVKEGHTSIPQRQCRWQEQSDVI
jgi:hypothetical protein